MKYSIILVLAFLLHLAAAGYGYFGHRNKNRSLKAEHGPYSQVSLYELNRDWNRHWDSYDSQLPRGYPEEEEEAEPDASRTIIRGSSDYYKLPEWMRPEPEVPTKKTLSATELTACIRSCPVTSEYNPVCGTDNITYQNPGRLECAKRCGVRVQLSRLSSCSAPFIPPNNNIGDKGHSGNHGNDNNSNSNTGNNSAGGGGNQKNDKENNDRRQTNNENGCKEQNNKKPPSLEEVMACTQLCPLSSEYNPVCGTDKITYSNPGRLLCSQFCGIDVKVFKFGPCSSSESSNIYNYCQCPTFTNAPITDSPVKATTQSFTEACLEACPASLDYKPVCGSDNITYMNLEKLNCAKRCGIEVALLRMSACTEEGTSVKPTNPSIPLPLALNQCIDRCSIGPRYEPICGTDNVTYNNTAHLICARQCGVDVEMKSTSACRVSNKPSTGHKETVTPYPNGLNFTIPPDVLASIFPESTHDDDDENVDIDKRFKEENNKTETFIAL